MQSNFLSRSTLFNTHFLISTGKIRANRKRISSRWPSAISSNSVKSLWVDCVCWTVCQSCSRAYHWPLTRLRQIIFALLPSCRILHCRLSHFLALLIVLSAFEIISYLRLTLLFTICASQSRISSGFTKLVLGSFFAHKRLSTSLHTYKVFFSVFMWLPIT